MPTFPAVEPFETFLRTENIFAEKAPYSSEWSRLGGMVAKGKAEELQGWDATTAAATGTDGAFQNKTEFTNPAVSVVVVGSGSTILETAVRHRAIWCCLSTPTEAEVSGYKLKIEAKKTTEVAWQLEKHTKSTTGTLLAQVIKTTRTSKLDKIGLSVAEGGKIYGWWKESTGEWKLIVEFEDTVSPYSKGFVGLSACGNTATEQSMNKMEAGSSGPNVEKFTPVLNFSGSMPKREATKNLTASVSPAVRIPQKTTNYLKTTPQYRDEETHYSTYALDEAAFGTYAEAEAPELKLGFQVTRATNVRRQTEALLNPKITLNQQFKIPRIFPATLTFKGTTQLRVPHGFLATLSFVGKTVSKTIISIPAKLTFKGSIGSKVTHAFSAVLSTVAAFRVTFARPLSATLSFSGQIIDKVSHKLPGVLSFSGSTSKSTTQGLISKLTFAGKLSGITKPMLAASLAFAGTVSGNIVKPIKATLNLVGAILPEFITETRVRHLKAELSFIGSVPTMVSHPLTSALNFLGSIGTKFVAPNMQAMLSFAGAINHNISHQIKALTILVTKVPKRIPHAPFVASLGLSTRQPRRTITKLSATLTPIVSKFLHNIQRFQAVISFSGKLPRQFKISRIFKASLTPKATISKRTRHGLSASISFKGTIAQFVKHNMKALLQPKGFLGRKILYRLKAVLPPSGKVPFRVKLKLPSSLSLVGTFRSARTILVRLKATVTFKGRASTTLTHRLQAVLSFAAKFLIRPPSANLDKLVLRSHPMPTLSTRRWEPNNPTHVTHTFPSYPELEYVPRITKSNQSGN